MNHAGLRIKSLWRWSNAVKTSERLLNAPASFQALQAVEPLVDFCLSKLAPSIADLKCTQNDR